MSRATKEINKITGTIISVSGKLIVYALVILLLYEGASKGFAFGHEIFDPVPVAAAPGIDKKITIPEDTSVSEAADLLLEKGLINNKYTFIIQSKFYDYEINPGDYTLNTSMTSKEMLAQINEAPEEEETDDSK
ncbi:MAG: endolytic transglycosylase MltG [Clostridiaceae bacterium]|nr:endolytic transglycosylase MltG [Clostridiaceae bacterium]